MGPVSGLSGGLIPNCCAANAIQQGLQQPADSAEGAAAQIKKDEAGVQARRQAIRYLGTVDCNWWPEAEDALCNALLKDRSECVRWEAALALQKGCCCTEGVLKALAACVSGTSRPAENSERVKAAAVVALSRCCAVVVPSSGEPQKLEEKREEKKAGLDSVEGSKLAKTTPRDEALERARQVLARVASADPNAGGLAMPVTSPHPGSVAQILSTAFGSGISPTSVETPAIALQATASTPPAAIVTPAMPVARTAPSTPVAPVSSAAERKPFFDSLTQALKGKQIGRPTLAPGNAPAVAATPLPPSAGQPAVAAAPPDGQPVDQLEISTIPVILPTEDPPAANAPAVPSAPE